MKKILKVASILGIASLVKIFSGLIRAKFLAWQLGPIGMGLVGQAQMYSVFTIQLCSLNIGMGITKGVSENLAKNDEGKIRLMVNTAFTFQVITSILLIFMVMPFSASLSKFVFSDSRYWIYFVGITLATPFAFFMTGLADPVFYGVRKIKECTVLSIAYILIGLGLLLGLVYFFKTEGMLAQIALLSVASFVVAYYLMRTKAALRPKFDLSLLSDKKSRSVMSHLFKYGIVSFVPANVNMLVMICLRGFFMKEYGVEANGYYQIAFAFSAYYLPFVMNGLWGHFYPEMCSLDSNKDINRELNQFIRFTLLVAVAIASASIIFRKYIITILFTSKFMQAYDLFAIQAFGDIFFVLFCMFSTSLMARKKFKSIVLISTLGYNAVLILSYLCLTRIFFAGFMSLNFAIATTNVALVAIFLVYSKFDTGFLLTRQNLSLLTKGMIVLAAIYLIPDRSILCSLGKISAALVWVVLSVTKTEMKTFLGYVSSRFNKKGTTTQGDT